MTKYLKLALKVLARRKFFTFISLFGISLTLLVLMVATALLDNEYAPRQPESRFDRVLVDYRLNLIGPQESLSGLPGYEPLNRDLRTLPGIETASILTEDQGTVLYEGGRRLEERLKRTDGPYWQILDFRFLEGAPFSSLDDSNGNRVAVITSTLRGQLFGNAPALGRTIRIEGESYRIVGVVPPVSITRRAGFADIWAPIGTIASTNYLHETVGNFEGIVLARSRADFPRLKREFATRMAHFPIDDPKTYTRAVGGLDTPFEETARETDLDKLGAGAPVALAALFGAAALLFMTLPALNLVTLNLSRILERAPEIGVRKAFGAPRRALVGQFVFENVVLSLMGGLIGFLLSVVTIAILNRVEVVHGGRLDLNLRIFIWGMLVAIFFGVFSGLYPAWKMAKLQPVDALRGGAQ